MLRNPAPSNGLNTVFGNIPASSAPAQGALAALNPSVQNNVKEPMVNPVASYPVAVRPYSSGWQHMFHPGDLIFVNAHVRSDRAGEMHSRFKPATLANLPLLNYFLRKRGPHKEPKLHEPSCWRFLGVMRNDMQMSGDENYSNRAGGRDRQQHAIRMINVDIRGSSRVFNYWAGARVGDNLYLRSTALDMRTVPEEGLLTIQSARSANEEYTRLEKALRKAVDENSGAEKADAQAKLDEHLQHRCIQVLPYVLDRREATQFTSQALSMQSQQKPFIKNDPLDSISPAVPVGWCFQHLGPAEESDGNSAIWNATQFYDDRFKLPTIPFFVRI